MMLPRREFHEGTGGSIKEVGHSARIPGFTDGAPSWVDKEVEACV